MAYVHRVNKKLAGAIISIVVLLILALYSPVPQERVRQETMVTNVIDGDTIVIQGGARVRLLGIDTPERGDFYYAESKKRLEELIELKTVALESEGEDTDQYDRLLRYVFLNGTNINLLLVGEGYASCYFYEESVYRQACAELEARAIIDKKGRWSKQ